MASKPKKFKILCFLDDDFGRDPGMVIPVMYFADKYLDCEVKYTFFLNIWDINRYKPDLVFIPNHVGSKEFFKVAKYTYDQGITLFSQFSEGNFRTDGSWDYWGWNLDHKHYEEFICYWSQRCLDYYAKEVPHDEDRMVLAGATGFDRYKYLQFNTKQDYLESKGVSGYDKVICYAGWGFGLLGYKQGRDHIKRKYSHEPNRLQWMEKQMHDVEDILRDVIEKNPDVLFVLIRHPLEKNPSVTHEVENEMRNLQDMPNALYVDEKREIHDLIAISDIWMAFESTTALESWLCGKQSLLINPDPHFTRDPVHQGSYIAQSKEDVNNAIKEFYSTGKISGFNTEEKVALRQKFIEEIIGYGDGLNHVRTGYYLKETVKRAKKREKPRKLKFHFRYFLLYYLIKIGSVFFIKGLFLKLPKFKKTVWIFERHKMRRLPALLKTYYSSLDAFHSEKGIANKINEPGYLESLVTKPVKEVVEK